MRGCFHLAFGLPTGLLMNTIRPNQSPEPTAVSAVSSAIAVHAASRRWLNFFRYPENETTFSLTAPGLICQYRSASFGFTRSRECLEIIAGELPICSESAIPADPLIA